MRRWGVHTPKIAPVRSRNGSFCRSLRILVPRGTKAGFQHPQQSSLQGIWLEEAETQTVSIQTACENHSFGRQLRNQNLPFCVQYFWTQWKGDGLWYEYLFITKTTRQDKTSSQKKRDGAKKQHSTAKVYIFLSTKCFSFVDTTQSEIISNMHEPIFIICHHNTGHNTHTKTPTKHEYLEFIYSSKQCFSWLNFIAKNVVNKRWCCSALTWTCTRTRC